MGVQVEYMWVERTTGASAIGALHRFHTLVTAEERGGGEGSQGGSGHGLSAAELVGAYKDLEFNEAGFRSLKAIDLDLPVLALVNETQRSIAEGGHPYQAGPAAAKGLDKIGTPARAEPEAV